MAVAVEELAKTAAKGRAADAASDDDKEAAFLQIAEETDCDTDQVQGVQTKNGPVQVRVFLISCAEEVFKYMLSKC